MKVIVVSGPTASGKTQTSINLAKKFGGEVVNFDSLLLYKEINIGTAKPTAEERANIPHHMIDVSSITQAMNASEYANRALPLVKELLEKKKIVYLVGGSGFYLQALLKGMYDSPTTPADIQERSDRLYQKEGIAPFLRVLKEHDPKSIERYHENDHYRIRRAVEHWWSHGSTFSGARESFEVKGSNIHGWDLLHVYLDVPRPEHQKIITERTMMMMDRGLIGEVKDLLSSGLTGEERPLQSIGYKETIGLLRGEYKSVADCVERIIINTRQLAKSQRTWFNRDPLKTKFNPLTDQQEIMDAVAGFLVE